MKMSAERQKCLQILGLSSSATEEAIKKTYKKLALQYHPDKNDDSDAKDQFQQISYAYKYLTDGPEGLNDTNNEHPDDFFQQMFTDMFFSQFVFRSGHGYFTSPFGYAMESDDDENYNEYFGFDDHTFFHSDSEDDYGSPPPCNHAYCAGCSNRSSNDTPRYEAPEPKMSKKRLRKLEKRKRQRERQKEKKKSKNAPKSMSDAGTSGKEKTNSAEERSSANNAYPTEKVNSSGKTNATEKVNSSGKTNATEKTNSAGNVEVDDEFQDRTNQSDSKDRIDEKEKSQQKINEEKLRQREKKRQEGEEKRKREQESREIAASVLKKQREKQEREREKRKEKDKKAAAEMESDGMSGWFYEDTSRSKKSKEKDKKKPEDTVNAKQTEEIVDLKQTENTLNAKQTEETVDPKQTLPKHGCHYKEQKKLSKDTEGSENLPRGAGLYSNNSKHNNNDNNNRTKDKVINVGKDGRGNTKSGAKLDDKKAKSKTESKFRNRFDILEDIEDNESDTDEESKNEDEKELENKSQTVQGKIESDHGIHPEPAPNIMQEEIDRKSGHQPSNDTNAKEKYHNFRSQYYYDMEKQGNRQNVGKQHFDKKNKQKNERNTQGNQRNTLEKSQNIDHRNYNDSTSQGNSKCNDAQHAKKMNNYPRGKPSFKASFGKKFQEKQNYGESISQTRWSDAKHFDNKPSETPRSHDNKSKDKAAKPPHAMSEPVKGRIPRSDDRNESRATPRSQRVFYNSKIKIRQTEPDDVENDVPEISSLYNSGRSKKSDGRNWTDRRHRESTTNYSSSAGSKETSQRFAYSGPNNDSSVNYMFGSGVTGTITSPIRDSVNNVYGGDGHATTSKTSTKDYVNNFYDGKDVTATNKTPTKHCRNNVFGSEGVSSMKQTPTNLQDSVRYASAQAMNYKSDNGRSANNFEQNSADSVGDDARNQIDHACNGSGRRPGKVGPEKANGKSMDHHAAQSHSSSSSRSNLPQYSYNERSGTQDDGNHYGWFPEPVVDEKDKGIGDGKQASGSYNGMYASNEAYLAENFSKLPGTYLSRDRAYGTSEKDSRGISDSTPNLKGKYEHDMNQNHLNDRNNEGRGDYREKRDSISQARPETWKSNTAYSYPTKPGVMPSNQMENKDIFDRNVGYTDYDMMQGNWHPDKSNMEFHPTKGNSPSKNGRLGTNTAESNTDFKATHESDLPENGGFSPHINSHNKLFYQRDAPLSFEHPSRPFNGVASHDANYNVSGYSASSHSNFSYYSSYPNHPHSDIDDNQNYGSNHYAGMNLSNGFDTCQSNITGRSPSSQWPGYDRFQEGVYSQKGNNSKTTNSQWSQQYGTHASILKGSNRNSYSGMSRQDDLHSSNLYGRNYTSIPDNQCSAHNGLGSSHNGLGSSHIRNNPSHVKLRPDIGDNISDVSSSLDSLDDACLDSYPSVPIGQFKRQTSNHRKSAQSNEFAQPMNQQVPYTYCGQQTPPSSDYRVGLDYGYDFGPAEAHIGIHESLLLNDRVKNYYKQ